MVQSHHGARHQCRQHFIRNLEMLIFLFFLKTELCLLDKNHSSYPAKAESRATGLGVDFGKCCTSNTGGFLRSLQRQSF